MLEMEEIQVEIPVKHHFFAGMYAREIVIPAGTLLTGKIHKYEHYDIMISGDISVSTDEGVTRLTGFNLMTGGPGKKRAGFAHEDTHWLTFNKTDVTDERLITDHITVDTFDQLDKFLTHQENISDDDAIKKAFERQVSYRKEDYEAFKKGYLAAQGDLLCQ